MSQAEKTKENLEMVDYEGLAGQKVYFRVRRKNTKLENQIESYETANISLFLTFKNLKQFNLMVNYQLNEEDTQTS